MVIFLVVTIATTLGAAGRAAGLPPTLPRTVADILETVTDILGTIVDILETIAGVLVAVTNIPGVTTNSLGAVTGILGAVADILGVGVALPLAHPAATASHTALPLVTAIAVVTEGEFVLFLRDKHRVVFALAVHTGKRLAVLETGLEIIVTMKISAEHLAVVIKGLRRWHLGEYMGNRSLNLINAAVLGQTGECAQGIGPPPLGIPGDEPYHPLPAGIVYTTAVEPRHDQHAKIIEPRVATPRLHDVEEVVAVILGRSEQHLQPRLVPIVDILFHLCHAALAVLEYAHHPRVGLYPHPVQEELVQVVYQRFVIALECEQHLQKELRSLVLTVIFGIEGVGLTPLVILVDTTQHIQGVGVAGKRLFHIVARVAVVWALPAAAVVEEETQRISVIVPALAVGGIDAGGIGPSIALDELPVLVHEIDAAVYLCLLTQQFVYQQYGEPAAYGAIQLGYHRSHLAPVHLRPAHMRALKN